MIHGSYIVGKSGKIVSFSDKVRKVRKNSIIFRKSQESQEKLYNFQHSGR